MSRDAILHRVRTALGRSRRTGRPGAAAGAHPHSGADRRSAHRVHAGARRSAGRQDDPRGHPGRCARLRGRRHRGKQAVASNAPFLAECGITGSPGVRCGLDRGKRAAPIVRGNGCGHHQRRLRPGRYRHAGDALEPARGAPDLAAAAGAHRRSPRARILSGLDELFAMLPIRRSRPAPWC